MHLRRAFTLVELLVVIIVLSVLAAVVLPRFTNSSDRSKEARLRQDLRVYREAVDRFHADTGLFPLVGADLLADSAPEFGVDAAGQKQTIQAESFRGPYAEDWGKCPFCHTSYDISLTPPRAGWVSTGCAGVGSNGKAFSQW